MYKELLIRKSKGENINIKDLGSYKLHCLFIKERITKREIAELCDCTMGQVDYRLRKFGITFSDIISGRMNDVIKSLLIKSNS